MSAFKSSSGPGSGSTKGFGEGDSLLSEASVVPDVREMAGFPLSHLTQSWPGELSAYRLPHSS